MGTASLELRVSDEENLNEAKELIQQLLKTEVFVAGSTITAPMTDPEIITDLLIVLRNAGIKLTGVSVKSPTLDEVFLTLTGHTTEEKTNSTNE